MSTVERLKELTRLLQEARSVPMSASCMVNRAETLALVQAALDELPGELELADQVIRASEQERLRGRDEGDRIRIEAEEWAAQTANNTEIVRRAERRAEEILTAAREESEELRTETDAYVDQRMAEFEAALQKTGSQVKLMRARLASRSGQDSHETTPLPRI